MIKLIYILMILIPFSFAHAVVIKVNAEYSKSTVNSMGSEFRITDPCTPLPLPSFCNDNISRVIPVDSDIDKPIFIGGIFKWDRFFYHSFPSEKKIQLINEFGSSVDVGFSFTHTGYTIDNVAVNVGGGYETDSKSDCSLVDSNMAGRSKTVFYAIDSSAQKKGGLCYSRPYNTLFLPTTGIIRKFYVGYRLTPGNLRGIANGVYKGRIVLSVGSKYDIDFTNATYRSPSIVEIDITLVVRSQIKVIFPSASSIVSLTPLNGWRNLYHPSSLAANIPVKISSDSPFWISLICQYISTDGNECALMGGFYSVPISVYRKNHDGSFLLSPNKKTFFLYSRESTYDSFYFEIDKKHVYDMVKKGGSKYKGNITIVIDAQMPVGTL